MQLLDIAHARSGDKGDSCTIGVIAKKPEDYQQIVDKLTVEVVKKHFAGICIGSVTRYLMPKIHAVHFVLENCLDGGGTVSLRSDAQGKSYAGMMLRIQL